MKLVFIISPYKAGGNFTYAENVALAQSAYRRALDEGCAPFAPHLNYPPVLRDQVPDEREKGLRAGRAWLAACAEVWVVNREGCDLTDGMRGDLDEAARLGKSARWFDESAAGDLSERGVVA